MANLVSLLPLPSMEYVLNGHLLSFVPLSFNGPFTQSAKYLDSGVQAQLCGLKDAMSRFEKLLKNYLGPALQGRWEVLLCTDTTKSLIHLREAISH